MLGVLASTVERLDGASEAERNIWGEPETPSHIGTEPKEGVLRAFCSAFLSDVSDGFADPRLLGYSRRADEMLQEIRARAS